MTHFHQIIPNTTAYPTQINKQSPTPAVTAVGFRVLFFTIGEQRVHGFAVTPFFFFLYLIKLQ
jgi:hypothetical protein